MLVSVTKSRSPGKKYTATFNINGRLKHVNFGASGMDDYTKTRDPQQRSRYRSRHHKDLGTRDPTRPGFLSYYLLWGNSPNLQANIRAYKRRFHM